MTAAIVLAAIAVAILVGVLLHARRALRQETTARRDAEAQSHRLVRIGDQMSGALSLAHVCDVTARLAVQGVGGTGAWIRLSREFGDREAEAGDVAFAYTALRLTQRAGRADEAVFHASVEDLDPGPASGLPPHAVLAIRSDDGVLGHLVVLGGGPRTWSPHDIGFLDALVSHTALALSRGVAYESVAAASATLQASLQPGRHDFLAGVHLHSAYRPGASGHHVGGDWFDSIAVDDDHAVLVIGDAMGKGWRAAAVMGQVRTALRAAAHMRLDPAAALDMLDQGVVDLGADELVTVLYAVVDRARGRVGIARAGHPPALLLDRQGVARFLEAGGSPPIGVPSQPRTEWWVPVEEICGMVLYTDGIVETRTNDVGDAMAGLASHVTRIAARQREAGDGGDVWDAWLDTLQERSDWQDDVAVMVARLDPAPGPRRPTSAGDEQHLASGDREARG